MKEQPQGLSQHEDMKEQQEQQALVVQAAVLRAQGAEQKVANMESQLVQMKHQHKQQLRVQEQMLQRRLQPLYQQQQQQQLLLQQNQLQQKQQPQTQARPPSEYPECKSKLECDSKGTGSVVSHISHTSVSPPISGSASPLLHHTLASQRQVNIQLSRQLYQTRAEIVSLHSRLGIVNKLSLDCQELLTMASESETGSLEAFIAANDDNDKEGSQFEALEVIQEQVVSVSQLQLASTRANNKFLVSHLKLAQHVSMLPEHGFVAQEVFTPRSPEVFHFI